MVEGFARCVAQGALLVIAVPYFLGDGRHVSVDLPARLAEAAAAHEGVRFRLARALGPDRRLADLVIARADQCTR